MAKRHKYSAVATVVDGIRFSSKAEAARYGELKLLEKAGRASGRILDLVLQPRFPLYAIRTKDGEVCHVCDYVADFQYHEVEMDEGGFSARWRIVVEDVKGMKTAMYRLKKKMFEHQYGIEIREIGRAARRKQPVARRRKSPPAKPKPRAVAYQEHAK